MSNQIGCQQPEMKEEAKIIKGLLAAADELMTEFISKKRAANWKVINDGLYAGEQYLRTMPKPTVRR